MSDNQSHETKRFQLLSSVGQIGGKQISLPGNIFVPNMFVICSAWKIIP